WPRKRFSSSFSRSRIDRRSATARDMVTSFGTRPSSIPTGEGTSSAGPERRWLLRLDASGSMGNTPIRGPAADGRRSREAGRQETAMVADPTRIVIAGAGLAGLSLALALRQSLGD